MADDMPPPPKPPPGWYPHPQSPTGQRYWTGEHWGPPSLPPRPTGPPMRPRQRNRGLVWWLAGGGAAFLVLLIVLVTVSINHNPDYEDECRDAAAADGWTDDNASYDSLVGGCIRGCEELGCMQYE